MFDKLIDLLTSFGSKLLPFVVLDPVREGVICRWGKPVRKITTGFHWLWPFGIESAKYLYVGTRLAELAPQALVTKDGKNVVAGIVITYRVHDAEKALFSVWDVFSAAQDSCQATFAQAVMTAEYDALRTDDFVDRLTAACRKQGFKYGVEIERVRICELAPVRTIRLIGNGEFTANQNSVS